MMWDSINPYRQRSVLQLANIKLLKDLLMRGRLDLNLLLEQKL